MKMKFNVKKFIAKVLVAVLVISMMPSFGVEVKAADSDVTIATDGSTIIIDNGVTAHLYDWYVSVGDTSYPLPDGVRLPNVNTIVLDNGSTVYQESYANPGTIQIGTNCTFYANETSGISLRVTGEISNHGTLVLGDEVSYGSIRNDGIVRAKNFTLDTSKCPSVYTAEWQISDSLVVENGATNSYGNIKVNNDTLITVKSGATVNLYIGGSNTPTTVTGPVSNAPASSLVGSLSMSIPSDTIFYVGTTFDMSDYITYTGSYYDEGNALFRYRTSDGTALSEQPSTPGTYQVQPYFSDYFSADSWTSFTVSYYPVTSLAPTYTGISNSIFVKSDLTISPPDGWDIFISPLGTTDYTSRSSFSGYYVVGESYWGDNYGFRDAFCRFVKTSGENAGAITETISLSSLQNLIFDSAAPAVIQVTADGNDITFTNGMSIAADSVTVKVQDLYLERVLLSTEDVLLPVEEGDFKVCSVSYNAAGGATKTCSFTAYDYAGNETNVSFTLISYLSSDGLKLTVSGLANEKYAKDTVTLKAPDGYEILPSFGTSGKYVESVSYKKSDLYDSNGKFKKDLTFTFKRKSDGALTKPVAWDKVADILDDVVFDDTDPVIYGNVTADGEKVTYKSGCTINAYEVSLVISDINLEKIVIDKQIIDRKSGVKLVGSDYRATLTFTAQPGETKKIKFTAYDLSGRQVEYSFTIVGPKLQPKLTVTLGNQLAGLTYTPSITSDSDGATGVKYYYAKNEKASVSQNSFSETVPTEPGKYVVKAVIPETTKYLSATAYGEFTISYIDAPATAYTVEGEIGDNDYYISDVTLKAPTGYKISTSLTGKYSDSVTYSSGLTAIYLKRTSDGALTGPIAFENSFLIDTSKPGLAGAAKTQSGMVVDLNKLIFANSITFTIEDENLASVTVNNDPILISEGKAVITLTVNGHKTFVIKATDKAGNTYSFTVDLKAIWMESGVIPVGILVSLEPGVGYPLDPGEWLVEDDITLYYGGCDIYVTEDTELTLLSAED